MQLKAFVKMCLVFCWIWVYVCIYSQRSKGAKCLQTLHNISFSLGVCVFWPLPGIWCACLFYPVYSDHCKLLWYSDIVSHFLYSSMIIPDFFLVCNYKRFPRTQKSHNVYFWGSIRSYIFFPPFNAFHDWLYLTVSACVGCWIELPVSWCL